MNQAKPKQLYEGLTQHFDKRELNELCFLLGIDPQNFKDAKTDMIIDLIGYCERHGKLDKLQREVDKCCADVLPQKNKILFLAAEPTNVARLRLGQEFQEIDKQLRLANQQDNFILIQPQLSLQAVDISRALLNEKPQFVHFSGHGTVTGELCFETVAGNVHPVQPGDFAALFGQFTNQIKCVILNACYSEIQANAIAEHIDYVIGMEGAISDQAAIAFSIGFYQALGAWRTIEDAYNLGCVQIRMQNIHQHPMPVLIKRRGTSVA